MYKDVQIIILDVLWQPKTIYFKNDSFAHFGKSVSLQSVARSHYKHLTKQAQNK